MNTRIIRKTAEENKVTMEQMYFIQQSIFKFIKHTVEQGQFDGVNLPFFGKFAVKPFNRERYKDGYNAQDRIAENKIKVNIHGLGKLVKAEVEERSKSGDVEQSETGHLPEMPE
jgi:nucleoid DNA-binding protein